LHIAQPIYKIDDRNKYLRRLKFFLPALPAFIWPAARLECFFSHCPKKEYAELVDRMFGFLLQALARRILSGGPADEKVV
jgi:hypothetical protein